MSKAVLVKIKKKNNYDLHEALIIKNLFKRWGTWCNSASQDYKIYNENSSKHFLT